MQKFRPRRLPSIPWNCRLLTSARWIEGAELMALRGMRETIKRSPNMKLLIECSCNHADLVRFLRAHFKHISIVGTGGLESVVQLITSVVDNFAHL
jgi:hypothetical protein